MGPERLVLITMTRVHEPATGGLAAGLGGQSRWIDLDGPVHYLDFGGPARGPVIVCVHGLTGSAVNWSAIAPLLTGRCRLIAPDLAGHGLTQSAGRGTGVAGNRVLLHRFIESVHGRPGDPHGQLDGRHDSGPGGRLGEQAASVPLAGFTALQAVRDKARVQAQQKVLINGSGGGVGTFAVQIAKAFGAEVTGVCSTAKVGVVRSIGADHVIDYTKDDFTKTGQRYDALIDIAGSKTVSECRRILTRKGVLVAVGGPVKGQWISPLIGPVKLLALSPIVSQRLVPFLAKQRQEDLAVLRQLLEDGKVTPVIGKTCTLSEVPEAIRYLEQGHATGKVVITV